ncbi:MAG TPA: hypothetical protein VIL86_06815 [Tepidisphaeraceae bacterium]
MQRPTARVIFLLPILLAAAALAEPAVKIDKKPVHAEVAYFEPGERPAGMPELKGDEAAITSDNFSCGVQLGVTVVSQRRRGDEWEAELKVDSISVTLGLDIVEWLPKGVSKKLRAHEDGHKTISEEDYKPADKIVHQIAAPLIGKTLKSTGPDAKAAINQGMQDAMKQVNEKYMDLVPRASARVQAAYDALTKHGTNNLDETEAIKQAREKVKK